MTPKTDDAAQAIKEALREFDLPDEKLFEAAFHLTDWISELQAFVGFLENPDAYEKQEIQRILIAFLVHVPDHLKHAARIILDEQQGENKAGESSGE